MLSTLASDMAGGLTECSQLTGQQSRKSNDRMVIRDLSSGEM